MTGAPASAPTLELELGTEDLHGLRPFREILDALEARRSLCAGSLWGSSQALVLASLTERTTAPWLVVLSSQTEAEQFAGDLETLGLQPTLLPSRESFSATRAGGAHADADSIRRRIQVAQQLGGAPEQRPRILVASLLAVLQPVPAADELERGFLSLEQGRRLDTRALLSRLAKAGYERQPLAERPGEFSLRGDIFDLFPYASDQPLRIELFDDEIESLRTFDTETQRSTEAHSQIELCLAADAGEIEEGRGSCPFELLDGRVQVVEVEPLRVEEQAQTLRVQSAAHTHSMLRFEQFLGDRPRLRLQSLPGDGVQFSTRSVQGLAVGIREAPAALHRLAAAGERVHVLCANEAERARFETILEERGAAQGVHTCVGSLARGFRFPALKQVVVNHRELVGLLGARRAAPAHPVHRTRSVHSFFDLKPNDLVVHSVHGLARYVGLFRMERNGGEEEHLHLAFADKVSLYVPASRIDLVQRYIGSGANAPSLDKIGGQSFRKRKEKVERALVDLAAELLEVQALRELERRAPWPGDDELVESLIGSFPYTDTPDQALADREIRDDLVRKRSMDRLVCGDVGFGKTELAVRAAFRVVNGGGQVAVLVPTTVLARQHFGTFSERLADFPVEVASLSRYSTAAELREVVEGLAEGTVDVVIGTHRLLSSDVKFKKLGLVIVDEEQRFGVAHKEHFKRMRATTDILTLTATPIPRTLHMSLSGLRDISALTVPPEGRQEIETLIGYQQDRATVREAILREKNRGGQVFFLHNRVKSIERVARELMLLVPECSFAIGHGQMPGRDLERIMSAFSTGDVDVLVATTIIENGIDIPSAGTIIIDQADRFGLSELHQLRGRVGRGSHKAYCYLLVDRTKPMTQVARERLKALEELNQLGAGFGISMKDLEIRGSGNILGTQQSGHIAAVGYDMYCRLLRRTVERIEGGATPVAAARGPAPGTEPLEPTEVGLELGLDAFLPESWIPSQAARLELLRTLDTIRNDEDARSKEEMMRDRFGRIPAEAAGLLHQFRLRPRLAACGVRLLAWRENSYLIEYDDRVLLERSLGASPIGSGARGAGPAVELRPLRAGRAHLVVPSEFDTAEKALSWLEGLLLGAEQTAKMTAV